MHSSVAAQRAGLRDMLMASRGARQALYPAAPSAAQGPRGPQEVISAQFPAVRALGSLLAGGHSGL